MTRLGSFALFLATTALIRPALAIHMHSSSTCTRHPHHFPTLSLSHVVVVPLACRRDVQVVATLASVQREITGDLCIQIKQSHVIFGVQNELITSNFNSSTLVSLFAPTSMFSNLVSFFCSITTVLTFIY